MEVKDLLELINVKAPEGQELTLDTVREQFTGQFVAIKDIGTRTDLTKPIIDKEWGQRSGSLQSKIVSRAKELIPDLTHDKEKKLDDLIDPIFDGLKAQFEEAKKGSKGGNEDYERIKKEYGELKQVHTNKLSEYEQMIQAKDQEFAAKEQNWKIEYAKSEAYKKVPFSGNADQYKRKGFEVMFNEKYQMQAFEDGVFPVHADGALKGSRVKNPKNQASDLTVEELLKIEAEKADLLAKPHEGKQAGNNGQQNQNGNNGQNQNAGKGRVIPRNF